MENELDLVFACDCTGSMGSYIESAKRSISQIIEKIQASEKCDVRFALVCYRDHPPEEQTYVTQVHPFTTSVNEAKKYVQTMSAQGGGDTPEAVSDALHEVATLPYRKKAVKICVFVADAPPHGLGGSDDRFPKGWDTSDPMLEVQKLKELQIVLYSVGCEPQLGNTAFARDFFKAIASMTGGRYVSLANAQLLPQVIIGGASEEISLEKISSEIKTEVQNVRKKYEGTSVPEDQIWMEATQNLQSKGVHSVQMSVDDVGDNEDTTQISEQIASCKTLEEVRNHLKTLPCPNLRFRSAPYGRGGGGRMDPVAPLRSGAPAFPPAPASDALSQEAHIERNEINFKQVQRYAQRNNW